MAASRVRLALALVALALAAAGAAAQGPCVLQFSSGPETFDHCFMAVNVGDSFYAAWSPVGSTQIRWGLNASAGANAYVSLGYPGDNEDNAMIGGTAFVLQTCDSCASGAQWRQLLMTGTTTGSMEASSALPMASMVAEASGGDLLGAFTTDLPPPSDEQEVIYAAGGTYRNGDIRMHSSYGVMAVDLGAGTADDPEHFSKPVNAMLQAHIWLMLVSWGLLIPLGVAIAFLFKPFTPLMFKLHRGLQSLGLLLGLIGFGLGFAVAGGWTGTFPTHRNLGIAATVFGLLQLTAFFRPQLTSRFRPSFNLMHWWSGRASLILALANIFYGLATMVNTGSWGWGAYTAVIGTIFAGAVAFDSWRYLQQAPAGKGDALGDVPRDFEVVARDSDSMRRATNGNGATNGHGTTFESEALTQ